jgi:hypothetical protein
LPPKAAAVDADLSTDEISQLGITALNFAVPYIEVVKLFLVRRPLPSLAATPP